MLEKLLHVHSHWLLIKLLGTQMFDIFFFSKPGNMTKLVWSGTIPKWERKLHKCKNIVHWTNHFSLHICFNTSIKFSNDKMENSQQVSRQNKFCQKCDFCILPNLIILETCSFYSKRCWIFPSKWKGDVWSRRKDEWKRF